jgi:hypothetical protein
VAAGAWTAAAMATAHNHMTGGECPLCTSSPHHHESQGVQDMGARAYLTTLSEWQLLVLHKRCTSHLGEQLLALPCRQLGLCVTA